jgi:hypothetical protein
MTMQLCGMSGLSPLRAQRHDHAEDAIFYMGRSSLIALMRGEWRLAGRWATSVTGEALVCAGLSPSIFEKFDRERRDA